MDVYCMFCYNMYLINIVSIMILYHDINKVIHNISESVSANESRSIHLFIPVSIVTGGTFSLSPCFVLEVAVGHSSS